VQLRLKEKDPMIGTSGVKSASGEPTDMAFDVLIVDNLGWSTVAGIVLSKDRSWAIATVKPIIGKKNQGTIACQGDQSDSEKARECYPLGLMNLNKGDVINYTWAMTGSQQGVLEYSIWPMVTA